MYCPQASETAAFTSSGWYAIATTAGLYYNQSECEAGWYCIDGVARRCRSGRYGNERGMSDADCSGVCERGYYCPEGSTSSREEECGGEWLYCPEVS